MVEWDKYSEIFGCSVGELKQFSVDFFSAENLLKAAAVMDNFIDTHPIKDKNKLNEMLMFYNYDEE